MSGNVTKTRPSPQASAGPTMQQLARAVAYCYDDVLKDQEIARILGVTRRTLARWKHHPLWGPMRLGASAFNQLQMEREFQEEQGYTWPLQLANAQYREG